MSERPSYKVMRETAPGSGQMTRASGWYVQRASAFKRARRVASGWPEYAVTVWEYGGPGASKVHPVQASRAAA